VILDLDPRAQAGILGSNAFQEDLSVKLKKLAVTAFVFASFGFVLPEASCVTPLVAQAHADERVWNDFFGATEGRWRGAGSVSEIAPNGAWTERTYRADLKVDGDIRGLNDKAWTFDQEVRFADNITRFGTVVFSLEDGQLFISSHSTIEPAPIEASTPNALQWRSRRVDPITRNVWDSTHQLELSEDTRTLRGENRVWFNGRLTTVETYSLRKR